MKRDPLSDLLLLYEGAPSDDTSFHSEHEDDAELACESEDGRIAPAREISHERARQLILDQSQHLLPADEANALADHLLACDKCFRFAQDVAHQERQSGKHQAIQGISRRD